MATKTGKTYAETYPNDLAVDQSSGVGADSTTRNIHDGLGNSTAISLSDDVLKVQPVNDDTTGAFTVANQGGHGILKVDTSSSLVKVGTSQVNALTLFKEMGLYEFSPNSAGYHYPLICNRMGMQGAEALTYDNDWGNGTDPATTLDVSGLTDQENAVAVYWYLENNITLDSIRYLARADGNTTLNFHLFAYDLDTTTNYGDLSSGVVHANASVSATALGVRTGTFSLDTADIDAGKVVIGFVENSDGTDDLSVHFKINYHIR